MSSTYNGAIHSTLIGDEVRMLDVSLWP